MAEVYQQAPLRQLQLVSVCFDACMQVSRPDLTVTATDFYNSGDVIHAPAEDLQLIRARMMEFLRMNSRDIYIVDGNVKPQERYDEKSSASGREVPDVNRLTVLSNDLELHDQFTRSVQSKMDDEWELDEVTSSSDWQRNRSGFLVREGDYSLSGFRVELRQREEREFWLGQATTYPAHCVRRLPANCEQSTQRFLLAYGDLPTTASNAAAIYRGIYSARDYELYLEVKADLEGVVQNGLDHSVDDKKKALFDFQWRTHTEFSRNAGPEWQSLYEQAGPC